MASFADQVNGFTVKVGQVNQAVFVGIVAETKTSIVEGSPLTGSPGQPVAAVDGGTLRNSWQVAFESPTAAIIGTNVVYAESNEDGIARPGGGPYRLLAPIGGRRSVELTRMNFSRIVDDVAARLSNNPKPSGFQDNSALGGSGS